ncbi:DUF429 domain-containing protein [Actinomycetospora sp. TBRC 11914]|uniref:DUF429 domain-containing protein n=1 Tax=Actinomycetospora sp. TBRC 11914 TaxID=2729387 RepID=UPI00145E865F|nr:DUF429 domain-containing protein [Actinomycetospora sp. TBRC 11914]NMO92150.1 DUF429 domain-containing protein [Actinomycetospora sp. TBRC 11914]
MRVLAVDWSGDARDARRRIRVAEARPGRLRSVRGGLDRDGVGDLLLALRQGPTPAAVGLDFSFGLPGWFARAHGAGDLPGTWALAAADGERWLRECPPPFWGRPGTRRPADDPARPLLRRTEQEAGAQGLHPLSTFQVGGAGAVGTGSVRGMALLARWRAAGIGVWPLDPAPGPEGVLVVEVYPRAMTGPVVKSSGAARAAHVAADPRIPVELRDDVAATEDAFDAALAALGMAEHVDGPASLGASADPTDRLEGRMWLPPRG